MKKILSVTVFTLALAVSIIPSAVTSHYSVTQSSVDPDW